MLHIHLNTTSVTHMYVHVPYKALIRFIPRANHFPIGVITHPVVERVGGFVPTQQCPCLLLISCPLLTFKHCRCWRHIYSSNNNNNKRAQDSRPGFRFRGNISGGPRPLPHYTGGVIVNVHHLLCGVWQDEVCIKN